MFINILLLIIGFILLIKGADIFVDGASSLATHLKISKMLIGLTIIAFGTSAPEFAVSLKALSIGSTDMVLGNVIGSCILNILLILGVAAIIHPINIKNNTIRKELPLCMLISTILVVLFLDKSINSEIINQITRSDAIIILLFFGIFLYYLITLSKKKDDKEEKPKFSLPNSLILICIGILCIIFGSDMIVNNSTIIATNLGISERVISLTIIALGTSLPEFVTTIVSSMKGEQELLLGNIIGSNIFNLCIVLGIPVTIYGNITSISSNYIDLLMLMYSSILLFICSTTKKKINRTEGILMLTSFIVYYITLFL